MNDERIRERADDLKERARKAGFSEWLVESVAAFASAERDAERERCCQVICSYCRDGILLDGDSHRYENGVFMDVCRARAIRSRVVGKEKG